MCLWSSPARPSAFLALLVLLLSPGVQSQQPEPQQRITARVELVNVDVTVTDAKGNFVRGLKQENFRILDEGTEQRITNFAPVEAPAAVLVLVETSPAVYLIHQQHLTSAYALLDGLAADDLVALAGYDQSPRLLLPFSADKRALQAALGGLRYNLGSGELRLYDAVTAATEWLRSLPGKKALVLLSTGLDTSGKAQWDALAEKLRAGDVTLYPIALGGELRDFRGTPDAPVAPASQQLSFEEASRVLREMAETTGGQAFFPRSAGEFPGIYKQIATTLRHRYSLSFVPQARDGRYHRIWVQLVDDRGRVLGPWPAENAASPAKNRSARGGLSPKRVRYRLYTRRGYLAPTD